MANLQFRSVNQSITIISARDASASEKDDNKERNFFISIVCFVTLFLGIVLKKISVYNKSVKLNVNRCQIRIFLVLQKKVHKLI